MTGLRRTAGAQRPVLLACLLVLAAVPQAQADWVFSPLLGVTFDGTTTYLDLEHGVEETKLTFGGSGGWLSDGLIGVEVNAGYTPGFFDSGDESRETDLVVGSSALVITGDVLVLVPRSIARESLRPYVLGGVGLLRVRGEFAAGALEHDSRLLGLAIGGGAIGALTDRTSLRFDVRRISNLTTDDESLTTDLTFGPASLSFWRATIGVLLAY